MSARAVSLFRRPGDLATWRPGDLATWRPGDLATYADFMQTANANGHWRDFQKKAELAQDVL